MMPIGTRRDESLATTGSPKAASNVHSGSMRPIPAVLFLALGVVSICVGLYCLIQALDVFNLPMAFKVWFSRAVVAMVIGWILLHIGSKRIEAFWRL